MQSWLARATAVLTIYPLVGAGAQAATVMAVTEKSPSTYPESYCYGFFAGFVGAELTRYSYAYHC